MKKSEIRKLITEYNEINLKIKKIASKRMLEKLKEIEHRYFHETGRDLKSDLKEIT